jgi:hypothetical protein
MSDKTDIINRLVPILIVFYMLNSYLCQLADCVSKKYQPDPLINSLNRFGISFAIHM